MTDYFFVDYVKDFCQENGIGFTISPKKLKENCSGCLSVDENSAHLKISAYKVTQNDFIMVLLHEFGHVLQYLNTPNLFKNKYYEPEILNTLIENQEPMQVIKPYLNALIDLELNNIKQLPSLIKEFDLDIDVDYLIMSENWLLYRYLYWAKNYRWMRTKKEYGSSYDKFYQTLVNMGIPNNLDRKFRYLPKRIEEAIDECCYPSKF